MVEPSQPACLQYDMMIRSNKAISSHTRDYWYRYLVHEYQVPTGTVPVLYQVLLVPVLQHEYSYGTKSTAYEYDEAKIL